MQYTARDLREGDDRPAMRRQAPHRPPTEFPAHAYMQRQGSMR